ncbi:MAG: hypothetical protein ACI4WM_04850 [Erysipelotrichaceae bacterium]
MKISVIKDEYDNCLGYLLYYEYDSSFIVELPDDADEWKTPLLLSSYVKRRKYTVYPEDALLWVKERIVPNSRQNIGSILKDNNLKEYDEYKLLILNEGRCSQDNYYLENCSSIPSFILERQKLLIKDFLILENRDILLFFNNSESRIYRIQDYESISISAGGYGLIIDENTFIKNIDIYTNSTISNIKYSDFISFVQNNIVDASEAAAMSGCTRQNIKDLKDKEKLPAVKENSKYSLFLRSDVLKNQF